MKLRTEVKWLVYFPAIGFAVTVVLALLGVPHVFMFWGAIVLATIVLSLWGMFRHVCPTCGTQLTYRGWGLFVPWPAKRCFRCRADLTAAEAPPWPWQGR